MTKISSSPPGLWTTSTESLQAKCSILPSNWDQEMFVADEQLQVLSERQCLRMVKTFSVRGFWEESILQGARREGVKDMCARDTWWDGPRACLNPGMTEGGFTHCSWWGLFSSPVKYHYITPPVTRNPARACHSNSLRSNPNTLPLPSSGGWRRVKETHVTTSFCWTWKAEGELVEQVDGGQLSKSTYDQTSATHILVFFFLFKETLFEFHFSIWQTVKACIPALLLTD